MMNNGRFEDVLPIENGDIPASYVSLWEDITDITHSFLEEVLKKPWTWDDEACPIPHA